MAILAPLGHCALTTWSVLLSSDLWSDAVGSSARLTPEDSARSPPGLSVRSHRCTLSWASWVGPVSRYLSRRM
jgi:hypothetical protein